MYIFEYTLLFRPYGHHSHSLGSPSYSKSFFRAIAGGFHRSLYIFTPHEQHVAVVLNDNSNFTMHLLAVSIRWPSVSLR